MLYLPGVGDVVSFHPRIIKDFLTATSLQGLSGLAAYECWQNTPVNQYLVLAVDWRGAAIEAIHPSSGMRGPRTIIANRLMTVPYPQGLSVFLHRRARITTDDALLRDWAADSYLDRLKELGLGTITDDADAKVTIVFGTSRSYWVSQCYVSLIGAFAGHRAR